MDNIEYYEDGTQTYIFNCVPNLPDLILTDVAKNKNGLPSKKLNLIPKREVLYNVGRNLPCPCGSGKKFKMCCLGK